MDDTTNLAQAAAMQVKSSQSKKKSVEDDSKEFKERNQDLEWQDSNAAKTCHKCEGKFTITNRKHHCRCVTISNKPVTNKCTILYIR